jgi:hypothetical protein
MIKRFSLIIGICLLIFSLIMFKFSSLRVLEAAKGFQVIVGETTFQKFELAKLQVEFPPRMTTSETLPIIATTSLPSDIIFYNCPNSSKILYEAVLSIAGMDISPTTIINNNTPYEAKLDEILTEKWVWTLHPLESGVYTGVVTIKANTNQCELFELSSTIQINVLDIFGLTSRQTKVFGLIGSFLGPILSLPWLLELWQKHKKTRLRHELTQKKKTTIIISSDGQEKEIEIDDQ